MHKRILFFQVVLDHFVDVVFLTHIKENNFKFRNPSFVTLFLDICFDGIFILRDGIFLYSDNCQLISSFHNI